MTRPRPRTSPVMTGAVDLSGLKQRAQSGPTGGAAIAGVDITEANFEAEVLVRSGQLPVVVLIWSPRHEICVALAETLSALATQDGGRWALALVDVEAAPRVAALFGVEGYPTVVALAGGQPVSSFQGPQPPEQLRRWIDSLVAATADKLGSTPGGDVAPEDPALTSARDLLDSGDFTAAAAAYQVILDADPHNGEAKGALRQITFLQRATSHPGDPIAAAEADPADIDAAFAAADLQILSQDVTGAFARLTALVKATFGDDRTRVRTRLIELFELFDQADPDVIAGRRNLANALY